MHWQYGAEKVISIFKDNFKAILTGVEAHAYMYSQHNFNKMPLTPMGCLVFLYYEPAARKTWDDHAIDTLIHKGNIISNTRYRSKMQEAYK